MSQKEYYKVLPHEYGTIDYKNAKPQNRLQFVKPVQMMQDGTTLNDDLSGGQIYQTEDLMNSEHVHFAEDENTIGTYGGQMASSVDDGGKGYGTTMSVQRAASPENATNETLDKKFYTMMLEIDKRYQSDNKLQKHEKIRIEQWVSILNDQCV